MTEFEKLKFAYDELSYLYEKERKKKFCSQVYLANLSASLNAIHQTMYALNELMEKVEGHYYEDDNYAGATIKLKKDVSAATWWLIEDWQKRSK